MDWATPYKSDGGLRWQFFVSHILPIAVGFFGGLIGLSLWLGGYGFALFFLIVLAFLAACGDDGQD